MALPILATMSEPEVQLFELYETKRCKCPKLQQILKHI